MATRKSSSSSRSHASRKGAAARGKTSSRTKSRSRTGLSSKSSNRNLGKTTRTTSTTRTLTGRGGRSLSSTKQTQTTRGKAQSRSNRSEAGKRGGERVYEEYGPDFYREIGRKGRVNRLGEDYAEGTSRGQGRFEREEGGRRESPTRWGFEPEATEDEGRSGFNRGRGLFEENY